MMKYATKSTDNNVYFNFPVVKRIIISALLAIIPAMLFAQNETTATVKPLRPVATAYTFEFGGSQLTDTYLSPLRYNGWSASIQYERLQAMKFNPERWIMQLRTGLTVDRTENPAKNATMWNASLRFEWGMMHRWKLIDKMTIAAGGSTNVDLGCLYSSRNGNNPASAKAAWTINLTAMATYNLKIGKLPITLRYQPTIPVTGVFFSPDYGELYYEIYLGDDSGLAHAAWWGNYFRMENLVTADLHLGNTCLRVGYRGNILSTEVNHLNTRIITNSFVLGISGEWISLIPGKGLSSEARTISALY